MVYKGQAEWFERRTKKKDGYGTRCREEGHRCGWNLETGFCVKQNKT